ncbi:MAG TPA: hypothetical protein VL625_02110 [Patescibacteria group bacterium]|nr:hypothetical protein [Patescibacteria group bacterium]
MNIVASEWQAPILRKAGFTIEYPSGGSGAAVQAWAVPGVSRVFNSAACGALFRLNPAVREILALTGKKLVIARRPDDIGRGSRERNDSDYFKRATAEVGGFYTADGGLFVVSEESWDRSTDTYVPMRDPHYVVPHEAFHAFDAATGFSDSAEFKDAYALDVFTAQSLPGYGYLLQPGARGRKEALAEAGCELSAGGCRTAGRMSSAFPHTFALTKAFVEVLERDFDWQRHMERFSTCILSGDFIAAARGEAEKMLLRQLEMNPEFRDLISGSKKERLPDRPSISGRQERRFVVSQMVERQNENPAARAVRRQKELEADLIRAMGGTCSPA